MSAQVATSTTPPIDRRRVALVFAPLLILVAAALVTNFGGGVARDAHAANSIALDATILTNNHITTTCGTGGTDGTLNLGAALAANTPANATCTVAFGSTNSTATLNLSATAANLGFSGFTGTGAACAPVTAGLIGISTLVASTATRIAPYNCATATDVVNGPTVATPFCSSTAGADRNCAIYVSLHTGTVAPGAKSGTLTQSLT